MKIKKAPSYKGTMRYARGATLLPSSHKNELEALGQLTY